MFINLYVFIYLNQILGILMIPSYLMFLIQF